MTPYEQLALIVAEQKTEIAKLRNELEISEQYYKGREEVENENARLRAALERIAKGDHHYGQLSLCDIAREALAKEEGK